MKTLKVKRRWFEDFNYGLRNTAINKSAMTLAEIWTAFSGKEVQYFAPVILKIYSDYGAAKEIDGKYFIYFDRRSLLNMTWNKFNPSKDKWVSDNITKTGIIFDTDIFSSQPNYRETYYDFEYDENSNLGKFIDKHLQPRVEEEIARKEAQSCLKQNTVTSNALF